MNANEKVFLLAEIFGVDVSRHIDGVLKDIENNAHFKKLEVNVSMARKYQVPYTQQFLKEYDELKISKITSYKDALVARAKIDYLHQISQPKYYINPLMFNALEMKTDITTIGELPCFYNGQEKTINEVVCDKSISNKRKQMTLKAVVDKWHSDAKETILDQINSKISRRRKFTFEGVVRFFKRGVLFPLLIILGGLLFLASVFSASNFFNSIVNGDEIVSTIFLVFSISYFLFLSADLIDYNLNKKHLSEQDYYLYYLKTHAYIALKNLNESTLAIREVIIDAIKNKREIVTPITKVNSLANFRRILLYLNIESSENKKYSEEVKNVFYIIKLFFTVVFIISLIAYIVFLILEFMSQGVIV